MCAGTSLRLRRSAWPSARADLLASLALAFATLSKKEARMARGLCPFQSSLCIGLRKLAELPACRGCLDSDTAPLPRLLGGSGVGGGPFDAWAPGWGCRKTLRTEPGVYIQMFERPRSCDQLLKIWPRCRSPASRTSATSAEPKGLPCLE